MHEPRNPRHILIVMLGGILAVAALALWAEHSSKSAHLQGLDEALRQSVLSLGNNISDSIEIADLALLAVEAEIGNSDDIAAVKDGLDVISQRLSGHARDLRNLHVIAQDGRVLATTVPNADMNKRFSDRAYFQFHAANPSETPLLGLPIVSRLSGERIVTITKRRNDRTGGFAGVLVAHLSIDRFNSLLERYLNAFGGASALLVHQDGTLLAATAEFSGLIGEKLALPTPLSATSEDAVSDVTPIVWPLDGKLHRTAIFISDHAPFSIHIGIPQQRISQQWVAKSWHRWGLGLAMLVVAVVLSLRWYRQAKLHRASLVTLRQREQELQLLADASGDLIERLSVDGVREYVSAAAIDVLGSHPADLVGTGVFDHLCQEERHATIEKFVEFKRDGSEINRVVTRYIRPDGSEAWLETTLTRLQAKGMLRGFVAITRDVTRRKLRHDELDALANTDTLTGLANRRAFDSGLAARLEAARHAGAPLSLLMIDVDRFKLYNDTYGHASGDQCLKAVATAIRSSVRRDDLAARYGGEEFAVILENAGRDAAQAAAEKIRRAIVALRHRHDRNLPWGYATVSIGTATSDLDGTAANMAQKLFDSADAALYLAKETGRNRVVGDGAIKDGGDLGKVANA